VLTFAGIGIGLILLALPLRLLGVRGTANRLAALGGNPRGRRQPLGLRLQHAARLADDCDAWLRRLRPINPCLRRSLLLLALLRRDGVPVTLVIGIRAEPPRQPNDNALAHAWLELDGEPILERGDPLRHHRPSIRYPQAPATGARS
jgi:hypothetical protein